MDEGEGVDGEVLREVRRVSDPHWLNEDPDTNPDPGIRVPGSGIRIQGFMTKNWKKFIAGNLISILLIKNLITYPLSL